MRQYIYWENDAKDTYLFGTSLTIDGKQVSFTNELIPSGNTIKTWCAMTNFQASRIQPDLPLLQKGKTYYLDLIGDVTPANSLYVKVTFMDRFHKEMSFVMLKDGDRSFTYPRNAYHYQIELVNAGMASLIFKSLCLSDEEGPLTGQDGILLPTESQTLMILFSENPFQPFSEEELAILEILGDVYVIDDQKAYEHFYCDEHFILESRKRISKLASDYANVYFVGYGPIGNFAALYYALRFKNEKAYVTDLFYDETIYQTRLGKADSVKEILESRKNSRVSCYIEDNNRDSQAIRLVAPAVSRPNLLKALVSLRKKRKW